ncbi:HlyD family secretion protein [Flavobacterium sp. SM15]|uniref:HlyD family secretion protein n=1 Tax=Flavobacterium sp. SM15 TaxID=2908005 RepID=UPI001EDB6B86|nr:HlyD family efflux transporter periplasmic adaptor subunit [Flavobacterium sp. SM15]MCG2610063.1 HlyD family secretion protein [Flavobacterium sp. SM15]
MTEDTQDFELRSEEVQDILTKVPHWMIRWGSLLVLVIIIMMLMLSWFLRYPDVVASDIVITTNVPPEKLVAKTSGRIEAILVKDHSQVKENTPLAVIENSARYQDVFVLKSLLDSFKPGMSFAFEKLNNAQLGEIENAYSVFHKDYVAENLNTNLQPFQVEANAQQSESGQLAERLKLLLQQKEINEQELKLQKNELNRYATLHKKGVISDQEFEVKKLSFLQSEKNFKNLQTSISQLRSSLIDNKRAVKGTQISGTKEEVNLERNVAQSFYQLRKVIKDWELNYVLRSSIEGEVSFLQIWVENQTISSGENVFSIVPKVQEGYVGKVKAPARNSGKIKVGQQVNIRLANYPDREFGVLKGEVKNIALVPDKDGNIMMDVALPKILKTNYKKVIPFQQEMKGSAEIITEDLRLLERILYQFRELFKTA